MKEAQPKSNEERLFKKYFGKWQLNVRRHTIGNRRRYVFTTATEARKRNNTKNVAY